MGGRCIIEGPGLRCGLSRDEKEDMAMREKEKRGGKGKQGSLDKIM